MGWRSVATRWTAIGSQDGDSGNQFAPLISTNINTELQMAARDKIGLQHTQWPCPEGIWASSVPAPRLSRLPFCSQEMDEPERSDRHGSERPRRPISPRHIRPIHDHHVETLFALWTFCVSWAYPCPIRFSHYSVQEVRPELSLTTCLSADPRSVCDQIVKRSALVCPNGRVSFLFFLLPFFFPFL